MLHQCRANVHFTNVMQHGGKKYHRFIAAALATHIERLLTLGAVAPQTPDTPSRRGRIAGDRLCLGTWGDFPEYVQTDRIGIGNPGLRAAILSQAGFQVSNLWPKSWTVKASLNANSTGASALLGCPGGTFATGRVAYIEHSLQAESATFTLNGEAVNTYRAAKAVQRVRQFTAPHSLPLRIRVTALHPGAYVEITNLVCST